MVASRGDAVLEWTAGDALTKILAVLPPEMEDADLSSVLLAGSGNAGHSVYFNPIRHALRGERKLWLRYADEADVATVRRDWPVALSFFAEAEVLTAWCELREDFWFDRMVEVGVLDEQFPKRRRLLQAEWHLAKGIDDPR